MNSLLLAILIPFGTFVPWTNPIPENFYESKAQSLENAYNAGAQAVKNLNVDWSAAAKKES